MYKLVMNQFLLSGVEVSQIACNLYEKNWIDQIVVLTEN